MPHNDWSDENRAHVQRTMPGVFKTRLLLLCLLLTGAHSAPKRKRKPPPTPPSNPFSAFTTNLYYE